MTEPNSAAWAWLVLVVGVIAYVVIYDVWAHLSANLTMSAQFTRWLYEEVPGPFIVAVYAGTAVGLFWHFLRLKH